MILLPTSVYTLMLIATGRPGHCFPPRKRRSPHCCSLAAGCGRGMRWMGTLSESRKGGYSAPLPKVERDFQKSILLNSTIKAGQTSKGESTLISLVTHAPRAVPCCLSLATNKYPNELWLWWGWGRSQNNSGLGAGGVRKPALGLETLGYANDPPGCRLCTKEGMYGVYIQSEDANNGSKPYFGCLPNQNRFPSCRSTKTMVDPFSGGWMSR